MMRIENMVLTDHYFEVPLDYQEPGGSTITVFAREVVQRKKQKDDLPWVVYFQGGPGYESPRPTGSNGWLKRLLEDFRVLLLDQRGTGLSSPVNTQTLGQFDSPEQQAQFLSHFRQDNIVRDAEFIRKKLLGENKKWWVFGQSFGGWCITSYLSQAAHGLEAVLLTGGLPPVKRKAHDVYQQTYPIVKRKNDLFYKRFPDAEQRVIQIIKHLQANEVLLPNGDQLTPERFQQLGLLFYSSSNYETLNYLFERAFVETSTGQELGYSFLKTVYQLQSFDTNPFFALLHEAIYAQQDATNWAAHRVREQYPEFQIKPDQRVYMTGEMIYPWMFDQYKQLEPLKEVAEILATKEDWPLLYDLSVLADNQVPVAAIAYYDDMCVARELSEETATCIGNCRLWMTNEYEHNGIGLDGDRILGRLIDMIHEDIQPCATLPDAIKSG